MVHKSIIIDEFYGWIPWAFLLRLLDVYPLQLPVKGGFVPAHYDRVYITSNKSPLDWYTKEKVGSFAPLLRRIDTCVKMTESYAPVSDFSHLELA